MGLTMDYELVTKGDGTGEHQGVGRKVTDEPGADVPNGRHPVTEAREKNAGECKLSQTNRDVESNGLRWETWPATVFSSCEAQELKDAGKSGLIPKLRRGRRELRVNEFIDKHLLGLYVNNAGHTSTEPHKQIHSSSSVHTWRNDRQGGCLQRPGAEPCSLPCPPATGQALC